MNKQLNLFSQEQLDEMIVRKHNYKMVRYIGKDGLVPDFYLPDHKIRLIEISYVDFDNINKILDEAQI